MQRVIRAACSFTFAVSAVCAVSVEAQNASAVIAPKAPVPPSVTAPVVEGTSVPQLTPSSDMRKMPARPQMPRPAQLPQNPSVPAETGAPKTASSGSLPSSSSRSSLSAANSVRNISLSAADISTLSSLLGSGNLFSMQGLGGMLSIPDTISGAQGNLTSGVLAGARNGQLNAADLYGQNQTAVLLQAVIEKLDALQKTVDLQNSAGTGHSGTDTKTVQEKSERAGHILRFIAGNCNILPSCTAVFISQPEADGSFLLTADRKYRIADKIYGETFYMLFKAAGAGTFNVAFSLSQQPENQASALYGLTQIPFLQAVRTGNLVTMRVLTEKTQIDLLLDIDFKAEEKSR